MTKSLSMDQALIGRLTEIVINNLTNEKFSAVELAKEAGLSYITLHRRLKKIKNQDVSEFIREIRLKRAMEMIRHNEGTFAEISYRTGFSSPSYFNKCFHEYYGYPPGEVRKKEFDESDGNELKTELQTGLDKASSSFLKDPGRRKKVIVLALAGLILISVIFIFVNVKPEFSGTKTAQPAEKSVVVLPFKNISDDQANQYFAEGIREDILSNLYRIKGLRVISKTTADQFKLSTMTSPEISARLKVSFILGGSVQKQSDKVRINVRLIDAKNDRLIWSQKYDRELQDLFAVQSDIALQVADNLETKLTSGVIEQIRKFPTKNMEAYNNYVYGRYFLNKNPIEATYRKSIEYFEKATRQDPNLAIAYAGMAYAYLDLAHYGYIPWLEGCLKSKELALKALELDKTLGGAHRILGSLAKYEFKWEKAIKEYVTAIYYEPDDAASHASYANLLYALGNIAEAREQYNLAKELDPLSPDLFIGSALINLNEGRLEEAKDDLLKIKEIDSGYNHLHRIYQNYYFLKGDTTNTIGALKKVCDTDPAYSKYEKGLMEVFNKSGYKPALEFWLNAEIELKNPHYIAAFCMLLNRKEEALNWLEKAVKDRHSMNANIYYIWAFRSLRSEPRFQALIKEMGLTRYLEASDTAGR